MADQGGFNFSDTSAGANAKINPQSEQFNSPEGQLKDARAPHDAGTVSESVSNKFRAEAGLTSFDSGKSSPSDFREFRESIRSSSGVGSVETKLTTFQTEAGSLRGFEHSGKDASGRDTRMFTSESGERFRVERGEDGRTSLRSENTGQRTEALRTQYDIKSINRSAAEVGPARVHRAGEPVDISSSEYSARARETRAAVEQQLQGGRPGVRPVEQPQGENPRNRRDGMPVEDTSGRPPRESGRVTPGEVIPRGLGTDGRPEGRPDFRPGRGAEGDGRPFDAREFRRAVETVDSNPQDRQARADLTRMMRENPGDSSRAVRAMQADGERMPAQVERFARMVEARNARGAEAPNTSPADLKALSANPEALRELMQNPETRKMMQSVLGREGNLDNLTKQLGLDANDPRTAKFFQELGNRLQTLKPGDLQSGNMKLQDVLKGLDPQSSKALENYLTHGIGKTGELRLSQVDQLRLNTLRGMLEGQGSMQRPTDLAQLLNTLKTRPLNLDQPTATAFGQNLRDLGLQLKGAETSPGMRLQDMINRSPDANSLRNPLGTTGNDFIARLNGPQEQLIRTLLDNSGKLANLIESGQLNIKAGDITGGTGMRMDLRNPMLSDVMTRLPQSMRGDSFVVRGDITGIIGTQAAAAAIDTGMGAMRAGGLAQAADYMNTAGRSDIPQSSLNPYEILSGKPIDPVSGLPYDPYTGKLLDPTTGRVVGSVRPGDLATKPGEKTDDSKRELENKDAELEEAARRKRRMMMLMLQAQKLREQKEKEIREKELKEQKRQQDDKKRTKYIVKYGDTLESIAQKELRNIRFSALIYDINKKIIPVVQEGGKSVVKLRKGLVIWLPSPFEQREFKSKIATGGGTMPTAVNNTSGETNKYTNPEEELAAKFGTNWSGSERGEGEGEGEGDADVSGQILADSVKKSEERIKNIESVLGDFDRPRPGKTGASGGKYVVRLGDTLKSVAMKHPLIRDISLWKLLAEVNNLSTATDSKGTPKASLTRGSSIKIPSQDEISEYRDKLGLTRAFDPQASRLNMAENQPKLRLCDGCGRMSVVDMPCPCGHGQKKPIAPTQIEPAAAAGPNTESGDFASSQNRIGGEAVKTDREEEASVEMPALADRPLEVLEDLDSMTRLVRHAQTEESPLIYAMQLAGESGWQTLISYEIRESKTYRHDDYSGEKRKSVKIDLPSRAAEELAKNDIVGNWKSYKRKFLRSRP